MRSWRTWLPWTVLAVVAALAAPTAVAPESGTAATAYLAGSAVLVTCTWVGAVTSTRAARPVWVLVAATASCWLLGDALQRVLSALGAGGGVIGAPDALWLASYPLLTAAVILVIRSRGLTRSVLQALVLDATVAAAAAGAIVWQVLVEPGLHDGGSPVTLVVRSLYPLGDVGIFTLALTLLMVPGRRGAPALLLLACLGLTLPIDLLYTLLVLLAPTVDPGRLDAALLLVNGCLAAAAVHRDRNQLTAAAPHEGQRVVQRWRLLLLGASLTTVLVSATVRGTGLSELLPSLVGAVVVALTVVARFHLLVRDQESARAALEHQAHHDQLTGLANRTLLHQCLAAQARSAEGVLLFFDLDGFKAVNDVHGHRSGDAVLRTVADRLRAGVRTGDTVARLGGDEFVALCRGVRAEEAVEVGRRLAAVIAQPIDLGGAVVAVGVSVGVLPLESAGGAASGRATRPGGSGDREGDTDQLLRLADEAMYRAKREGGGVASAAALALGAAPR